MTLVAANTDPIASEIGHGAPGLRDNLRPFSELVEASASQKHAHLAMQAGKMLTGWSSDTTAGVYVIPWTETWAGVLRDVVGVRTASETLVRAETLAACRSTAGTYYSDPDRIDSGGRWDDGSLWDDGGLWDDVPLLYVHLTGGADPDATSVQALAGFYYASASVAQPTFGPEKLVNGDFSSGLTGWTNTAVGAGGGAAAPGDLGVNITAAGGGGQLNAAGGRGVAQGSLVGVAGAWYRVAGSYRTAADLEAGIEARLRVGIVGAYLESNGRTTTAATTGFALTPTRGEERRFCFDFICPSDTAALELLAFAWNTTGGALTCSGVSFGEMLVRRIWRWERYEHRLSLDSLPVLEQARPDSWFGPIARGAGTLSLLNGSGPGSLDAVMAGLDWIGQTFLVYAGGRFVGGWDEILFDDCWPALRGVVAERPVVRDFAVSLPFEDLLSHLQMQVPPNTYDADDIADLAEADQGRRKPLIFGTVDGVCPARISRGTGSAVLGLPVYDLRDMSIAVASAAGAVDVHSYVDEEAAKARDAARRVTFALHVVTDPASSRLNLAADLRPIVVEAGRNQTLEFSVAGVPYTAVLAPGVYAWGGTGTQDLPSALQTALNAAGAGAIFNLPTYDLATGGKATLTASSAFAILTGTGSWLNNTFWPDLGFTARADVAAAVSQTSDTGMAGDCDELIVRMDGVAGYIDDASGTYTGTAGAAIEKAPDILRFLLVRVAGVDPDEINATTFEAARAGLGAEALVVYLGAAGESLDLATAIERLENSARGDLVVRRGKLEFTLRDVSPTVAATLVERDYLDFFGTYAAQDVQKVVRLAYGQDPASGKWRTKQQTTAAVALRFSRTEQRTFETCLSPATTTGAQATREAMLSLYVSEATSKRRRFQVAVRGKLFRLALGDVVELSRDRGLDETGEVSSVACRIVRKSDNLATWETVAELIEVV